MTALCVSLVGIILPVILTIAYKVGKIESQVSALKETVDNFISKGD